MWFLFSGVTLTETPWLKCPKNDLHELRYFFFHGKHGSGKFAFIIL